MAILRTARRRRAADLTTGYTSAAGRGAVRQIRTPRVGPSRSALSGKVPMTPLHRLRPPARLAAAGVLWAAAFAAAAQVAAPVPSPEGVLALTATAQKEVVRDLVAITFSTTKEGTDARAVQAELQRALDAALAVAKPAARPGQVEVQTGNFSLVPRYARPGPQGGAPAITGWTGTAEMVVEGRDLAGIGALVPRIGTMTVARVGQRLSREASQQVEGELVAEAVARFRARALEYAKLFGYASVAMREVSVQTSDPGPGPMPMMRMQAAAPMAADALAVEPGKTQVSATVNGTVQMK
jgi:predicted secreted protein